MFFDHLGDPYSKEQPGHFGTTGLKGTYKEIYKYFMLNVYPDDIAPAALLPLVPRMLLVEVYHNHLSHQMHIKAGH